MRPAVLVVDDDRAMRQVMCEVLEEEGHPVQTAEHGEVALERLHASAALLLVLLGLCMSVVTGEQVLEAVAADPTLAAQALGAGLVDECRLFLTPVVVGARSRARL